MDTPNVDEKLKRLAEIADWFDTQEEVDVEEGLTKVKEAATLIAESKTRLKEIENEFEEIKKELDPELEKEAVKVPQTETTAEEDSDAMPF
jgi:hypothetical protein